MVKFEDERLPKELVSEAVFIDYNMPISKARQQLNDVPAAIVRRNNEYYGVLDSKALSGGRSLKLQEREKVGKLAIKAPQVSSSTSLADTIYYFYKLRVKNLPYYSSGKIIGVISRSTVLKMLLSFKALDDIAVSEAMTSPVLAIDSNASLSQALNTMNTGKVNRLVVLENGRFVGIITSNDIHMQYTKGNERMPQRKSQSKKYRPSNIVVDSIMERNVATIGGNSSLSDAARGMVENKVSSLVVTKGNNPFGIVTISDIFENVVAKKRTEQNRVFVSGFDETTYQYEQSVTEEFKALMSQLERMHGLDIDYATMLIKRVRRDSYELQARISMEKGKTLRLHSDGETFHEAFSDLMTKIKKNVINEKDSIISSRKARSRGAEYEQ